MSKGRDIELEAPDGHRLAAYHVRPEGEAIGGLVVVQEIFGVNEHIRAVAEQYAAEGFETIAPSMFDRVEPGFRIPYSEIPKGIEVMQKLHWDDVMTDVRTAMNALEDAKKIAVVGYCWGGTVAHVAAQRLPVTAAVSYYGGGLPGFLEDPLGAPVMYHFGELDQHVPMDVVRAVQHHYPGMPVHVYKAGHGFNCDHRADYDNESAALAFERSVAFLKEHLTSA
jgi:carboxymethylenebutenolidase